MKPQMTPKEIEMMEEILSSYGPHIDVLEWGSGGSTVYFTRFLHSKDISYTWTSIEYNKLWYDKISEAVSNDEDVALKLFDVGNTELKQPYTQMDEYVAYPRTLGKKYDVILVDGRKRHRCLLEASKLLRPGGTAILHDARRTYYHGAFSAYPNSRMLLWTGLWQGKLEDPGLICRAINFMRYWCFRAYTFSFRLRPRSS
ncbi:MAG: class I SAM-dependent methyltransferase [Candidatus Pacebacteria bacterium]|nr:class I SAM-dependent methyltransferase [Candidatus Paceibacterota bacterium]